ncbi:S26 family signal peptidase [Streptomyces sp. NPDC052496]|uniref:S26 family signal peptidase n=1 Tax=Streptomyces sp. NPDC052496 TaxID=3154951 RepID=UPI0034474986
MSVDPRPPVPVRSPGGTVPRRGSGTGAEAAPGRARGRARRALLLRLLAVAATVLLGASTGYLAVTSGPGWAVLCGVPALLLGLGLSGALVLERRIVTVTVQGQSMTPAYHDGDRVLVRRRAVPVPGSVVVVERPPFQAPWPEPPVPAAAPPHRIYGRQWVIKRVAAGPGDAVPRDSVPSLAGVPEPLVPDGRLVLLGDNAAQSYDSRQVGYFPSARVLGVVVSRGGPAEPDGPHPLSSPG